MMYSRNLISLFGASLLAGLAVEAKLSDAQISSVFPGATELYGVDQSFPKAFDGSFVANSTHLLSVLSVSDGSVGWIGLGTGAAMVGSDTLIMWPNSGSWVISHGVATGYITPKDLGASPSDFSIVSSLSTDSTVAFLRKLDPDYSASGAKTTALTLGKQSVIFARASVNPGSDDPAAEKAFHDVTYGTASLDLSAKIAAPAVAAPATTSSAAAAAPKVEPTTSAAVAEKPAATPESAPASKAVVQAVPSSVEAPAAKAPSVEVPPALASPNKSAQESAVSGSGSAKPRHRPNHHSHVYPRPRSSHLSAASGIRKKAKPSSSGASGKGSAVVLNAGVSDPTPTKTIARESSSVASGGAFAVGQAKQSGSGSSGNSFVVNSDHASGASRVITGCSLFAVVLATLCLV